MLTSSRVSSGTIRKWIPLVHHYHRHHLRLSSTGPATVVDVSFWKSLVPKPLRRENRGPIKLIGREWNPATFFIVMFLFIGSMSIQMITMRNQFDRYMRQSTTRISVLREVVEKIQRGEHVDVEKALGTGDPKKEADWEEMLRAIEREELSRKAQKKERSRRAEAAKNSANGREPGNDTKGIEPSTKTATSGFGNFF